MSFKSITHITKQHFLALMILSIFISNIPQNTNAFSGFTIKTPTEYRPLSGWSSKPDFVVYGTPILRTTPGTSAIEVLFYVKNQGSRAGNYETTGVELDFVGDANIWNYAEECESVPLIYDVFTMDDFSDGTTTSADTDPAMEMEPGEIKKVIIHVSIPSTSACFYNNMIALINDDTPIHASLFLDLDLLDDVSESDEWNAFGYSLYTAPASSQLSENTSFLY